MRKKIMTLLGITLFSLFLMSSSDCTEKSRNNNVFNAETIGYYDGNKLLKVNYKNKSYIIFQHNIKRTMVLLTVEEN